MSDPSRYIGKTWDYGLQPVEPEPAWAYALATSDPNPAYQGEGAIAPPMFHVRLMKPLIFGVIWDEELQLDALRLVHGEHHADFLRPVRIGEALRVHGELLEVSRKRSGLLVNCAMMGDVGAERVVDCRSSFFIRDAAPPSGPKPARAPAPPPADFTVELQVPEDASYRYAEASLDDNPIHVDPAVARAGGHPDVILQGLCTMAMTVKTAVYEVADGHPALLRHAGVRFARPVFNGQRLTVRGWERGPSAWALETLGPDGRAVISGGLVRFG
ncbi:MAG: MaoC family dehydratase N-terminal domain-containing protein [Alphaproteobacteria bacterium]|nr:MaoC family dehydratase N-terminal domain-containing protein [Alphaproteobacteria bacterium]